MRSFDPTFIEAHMANLDRIAAENGGTVPQWAVSAVASQMGCSVRSVWNWFERHQDLKRAVRPAPRRRKSCELTEEMLREVAAQQGRLKDAWQSLVEEDRYQRSYRQFARQFAELDPIIREGLTRGVPKALAKGIYLKVDTTCRLERLAFDHAIANVFIRRVRAGKVELFRPYVSVIIDVATRFCLAFVITEGDGLAHDPGTESVATLLGAAIRGQTARDEEGTFLGGLPAVVQFDNPKAHVAEAMLNGFLALGIASHAITPRSPWQNGRVERFIQTMENEFFLHLPGATEALEDRVDSQWKPEECDTIEVFVVKLQQWIDRYNFKRRHRELKCTPFEAWKKDETPIRRVEDSLLRHVFLAESRGRMVSKSGIRFRKGRLNNKSRLLSASLSPLVSGRASP